jgi:hypothetical protein
VRVDENLGLDHVFASGRIDYDTVLPGVVAIDRASGARLQNRSPEFTRALKQ